MSEVRTIHLSCYAEPLEGGGTRDNFAMRLGCQMGVNEVWEILVGGLIAAYKTEIGKHIDAETFVDETVDRMRRMLESTSTRAPTIN